MRPAQLGYGTHCDNNESRKDSVVSENRDYYEVLGVDKDADARTIKRAFLK
ncbi:MAG: molecular chaperone DnaJ, partial [Collinsella sp.]|nr:molecular chaperone DnaJ [Collinsella sp.]